MAPDRITVFLPCHSLDDFPTWLDEPDADALLEAWTAAWHPWLMASVGAAPWWASVDLPPVADGAVLGIVPAPWDDRFGVQAEAICAPASRWVRGIRGRDAIVAAAAAVISEPEHPPVTLPGDELAADFHALGLATLLLELLARRMRSHGGVAGEEFAAAAVAAARAAVGGDESTARERLLECYGCLEASRARFYPVDVWLVDLILLAESTLGAGLDRELLSPVPGALVATGRVVETLAIANPAAVCRIRERIASGTLEPTGGRYDSHPLDLSTPEEIRNSLERGAAVWREHAGVAPTTYAQCTGGSSAMLPQLLNGLGFKGAVWTLFDGTPLPDPAAGRIRWEGTGGGCVDAIARPPEDVRQAKAILSLPGRIGDAMDHEHTVVIPFAHHAGTASRWHDELRRIGATSTALGTFVTPHELFSRTSGMGTTVSFEPDGFPVTLPPATRSGDDDPVAAFVTSAGNEAVRLFAARAALAEAIVSEPARSPIDAAAGATRLGGVAGVFPRLFSRRKTTVEHVLDNGRLRVQVHPGTGGLLSVRRPEDRSNRLSQRLAIRTTRPAPPVGQPWEDLDERAEYAAMEAEAIERMPDPAGHGETIVSRGRLRDGRRVLGGFTQRVTLVEGLPLAVVEVELRLADPPTGPLWEHHAACRFAWHENDDVEVRRSLHTQSVATERGRFTAPWYVELCDAGLAFRPTGPAASADVALLTGGLPWHVRSGGHMLDSILPWNPPGGRAVRLAVGVGLERPWDAAMSLLSDQWPTSLPQCGPDNVRVTAGPVRFEAGRLVEARIGLLESRGRPGEARLEWHNDVVRARICDAAGREFPAGSGAGTVVVDGRVTTVTLRRYEWLHLDLEFAP